MTGGMLPLPSVCPLALYEDECHIDNALTCPDVRTCRSDRTGVNLPGMVFAGEIYRVPSDEGCMSSLW